MVRMKRFILLVAPLLVMLLFVGCMAESPGDWPDERGPRKMDVVVTVKQAEDGTVFFQLSDYERLYPGAEYPFTRQHRAWGSVTIYAEEVPLYGHVVDVEWMEPLDEGSLVGTAPHIEYPAGLDPVNNSWITSVEDGYLTLHYKTWWGDPAGHHDFYLVQADPENPYNLTLLQDAHSDSKENYSEGIICFDINSLPDTGEETKILTLYLTTTKGGTAIRQFEFRTRK